MSKMMKFKNYSEKDFHLIDSIQFGVRYFDLQIKCSKIIVTYAQLYILQIEEQIVRLKKSVKRGHQCPRVRTMTRCFQYIDKLI
jgi:hypothetical protein